MITTDAAGKMKALAEAWAASDPALDFSWGSLAALESHVTRQRRAGADVVAAGAYLGETIVRNGGGRVAWVEAEVLSAGEMRWFPTTKVEKFLKHGQGDSLVAFAAIVAAPPPEPPSDEIDEETREAAAAFLASPTPDTLDTFERTFHGSISRSRHANAYRALGIGASPFLPFLSEAAAGRGYKRIDPGMIAAYEIERLLQTGVEPREPTMSLLEQRLGDKDKVLRTNAAYVVAARYLREGHVEELIALAHRDDATINAGAFAAFSDVVSEWFDELLRDPNDTPPDGITPYLPLFQIGLTSTGLVLTSALQAVSRWEGDRCALLPAIVALLDHGKPSIIEDAAGILTNIGYDVMHGRAKYDATLATVVRRLAELTLPKPGAKKVAKTQIAARSALSVFNEIRSHLDPETAALVERALAGARHIR